MSACGLKDRAAVECVSLTDPSLKDEKGESTRGFYNLARKPAGTKAEPYT